MFIAILLAGACGITAQVKSVYTGLGERSCKTVESTDDEGGSYRGICPGVAGFKLELIEGDLRQSINVVDRARKKHELNLWNVSGGFSFLGPRAEWRMKGRVPIALIIRFNVSENPEDSSKTTSYLVVAKITKNSICVADVVGPTRTQNVEARKAADTSAEKPCRFE